MKKLLIPVIFLILLVIGFLSGLIWWRTNLSPVSADSTPVRIVIPKGRSAVQIGNDLKEKGLIRSPLAFKVYVQVNGQADRIQAGEFELAKNLSVSQIIEKLSLGPLQLWVTIPEGLRREEIAVRLAKALEMDDAKTNMFYAQFMAQTAGKEGFLFPDTYLFPRDASVERVVSTLTNTFTKKISPDMKEKLASSGRTLDQVVIMASILEKETLDKDKEERPIVAGVLWKRMAEGWPLQADAAVQYAVASQNCKGKMECEWWPKSLTKDDLEVVSPYNTYKNSNLPPTPISNPGLSTLEAAINPQESEYWYYIHDSEGNIHFAKTLEEHNSNVSQYLR